MEMLIDRDSDYRVVLVVLRIYKTGEDLGCRNHILILDVFVIKKMKKGHVYRIAVVISTSNVVRFGFILPI